MNKKGFTLIEVMVATAILAMMVVMIWTITSTNFDAVDRAEKRDTTYQMARFAMRKITEDINMAYIVTNPDLTGKTKDGMTISYIFAGEEKGFADSIDFVSFSNLRMIRNSSDSDQNEIGYYTEPDPDAQGLYILMRRSSPNVDNDITKGGDAYPVATGVKKFSLSYYDKKNEAWVDNWNSSQVETKDRLPRAVKIVLSFQDPVDEDKELNFETIAFVDLWQAPIDF